MSYPPKTTADTGTIPALPHRGERCWLCGSDDPPAQVHVTVNCAKPGGRKGRERLVCVHFGCYQDMDQ